VTIYTRKDIQVQTRKRREIATLDKDIREIEVREREEESHKER